MHLDNFFKSIGNELDQVKKLACKAIDSDEKVTEKINEYVFADGGKLLRPALVISIGRTLGLKDSPRLQKLAAAMEIIHSATLIHDDVIDKSAYRRNKKAVHEMFGCETAILYGDYLYTAAISLVAGSGNRKILSRTARTIRLMCEGEIEQQQYSGNPGIGDSRYMSMIRKKTAGLFSCCCFNAAIAAKADAKTARGAARFGFLLGIAYQILDDCRDYSHKQISYGKNTGADLAEGRVTLPLIYCFSRLSKDEKQTFRRDFADRYKRPLLHETIAKSGGIAYSCNRALKILDHAKICLKSAGPSNESEALQSLLSFLVDEAISLRREFNLENKNRELCLHNNQHFELTWYRAC